MVSGAEVASATARAILSRPITAVVISSPGMPDSREHFRFAQPRRATADGAGANQRARHLGTLVGLAVGTEGLAPRLEVRRHLCDVVVEGVEIEEQGWSGDVAAGLHPTRMLALLL